MAKRVFIVDDDNLYRSVLENILSTAGYEVCAFANGEDCLKDTRSPDLMVVDFYLNSENRDAMNGIESIKRIRERLSDLPVIVLSGRADLTSASKSSQLTELLQDGDRNGLVEAYCNGAYFYMMKDSRTKDSLVELSRAILR